MKKGSSYQMNIYIYIKLWPTKPYCNMIVIFLRKAKWWSMGIKWNMVDNSSCLVKEWLNNFPGFNRRQLETMGMLPMDLHLEYGMVYLCFQLYSFVFSLIVFGLLVSLVDRYLHWWDDSHRSARIFSRILTTGNHYFSTMLTSMRLVRRKYN